MPELAVRESIHRIGILHQGRLIALGTMDELRKLQASDGKKLEEIFLEMVGGGAGANDETRISNDE